jgi:hypothetical protein
MKKMMLVSIWRCGSKLYKSYTDGTEWTVEVIEL